jgi:hypothetical protein
MARIKVQGAHPCAPVHRANGPLDRLLIRFIHGEPTCRAFVHWTKTLIRLALHGPPLFKYLRITSVRSPPFELVVMIQRVLSGMMRRGQLKSRLEFWTVWTYPAQPVASWLLPNRAANSAAGNGLLK